MPNEISDLPAIDERRRLPSPMITPQALAWHHDVLWMGSRDLQRICRIEPKSWTVQEELEAPGIPWAAVSTDANLWFTLGQGENDDRYLRRFTPGKGFSEADPIACPEFTGSYLSHDCEHLYLSQWYRKRILQLDPHGTIVRTIDVGAEICGHTFVDGMIYLLRGVETPDESWSLARLDPKQDEPVVEDLARIGFACRSLTHDGTNFWTNHRAANETVSFGLNA